MLGIISRQAAKYLDVDNGTRSDGIVILAGGESDERYWQGLTLLREGFGKVLLLDARSDYREFGSTDASLARQFVDSTAGPNVSEIKICPIKGDSTSEEAVSVEHCLRDNALKKLLLVTSDYHTRRALSIFEDRLPQYKWSVAAVRNQALFGKKWWYHSQWTRTTFEEWMKLMWWELIDRWL